MADKVYKTKAAMERELLPYMKLHPWKQERIHHKSKQPAVKSDEPADTSYSFQKKKELLCANIKRKL